MITEQQCKDLVDLAAKSKRADFLNATDRMPGISRDVADAIWKCAKLIGKAERLAKLES